ncbi:MAG: hypothetical protein RIB80_01235 [Rhodospirillales bacterium]
MNANVIEFYKKVRADKGLIEALSEGKTDEAFSKIAIEKAAELGIHLETADTIDALKHLDKLVHTAANDDALTDFELELIAAGITVTCYSGEV